MSERAPRPLGSRYVLDREIGRGATSVVWCGRVKETGERVAAKVLRPEFAADPEIVARFTAERTVLMAVDHPNLVRVHDLVADADVLALIFEYVDGVSLRDRLRASTLPASDAMAIGRELADALAALHAAEIVHCDVKPGNVLLTHYAQARLADLGIAWLTRSEGFDRRRPPSSGTPGYLAPEVAIGATPGPPADVYALGVVLYEVLMGRSAGDAPTDRRAGARLPMPRDGGAEASARPDHAAGLARIPDVPRHLWRVVGSCLRADPAGRPSAATVASLLTTAPRRTDHQDVAQRSAFESAGRVEVVGRSGSAILSAGGPAAAAGELPTLVAHADGLRQHHESLSWTTPSKPSAGGGGGRTGGTKRATARWIGASAAAVIGCLAVVGWQAWTDSPASSPTDESATSSSSDRVRTPHGSLPIGQRPLQAVPSRVDSPTDREDAPHGSGGPHRGEPGTEGLERYEAPTGWLCRRAAALSYGAQLVEIQPCIAVGRTTARAAIRHTVAGPATDGAAVNVTLQLLTDSRESQVLRSRRCRLPATDGECPDLTVYVAHGETYYAVVSVETGSSSAKPLTLRTPIIQNNQPQDRDE